MLKKLRVKGRRPDFLLQRTTAALTENALLGIDNLHLRRGKASLRRSPARRAIREYRQHALNCVHLAKTANRRKQETALPT